MSVDCSPSPTLELALLCRKALLWRWTISEVFCVHLQPAGGSSQQPAEHRSLNFLPSFFLMLHRDSPAEPCDGTPVLDAGHLALRPTRRRHLPYNEALPVPGGSAHLSRGAAHAQLLVSPGVFLCWQQLLDWSRHSSRVLCYLGFFSNGKVHKFSPTKRDDVVVCDCMVWLSFSLKICD